MEGYGGLAATQPMPMPTVTERQSIVKEYEWAVTDLQAVVAELTARLQPVLRPLDPENNAPGPMPPISEHRQRLHDLAVTTGALRGLLDRLEV